MTKPVVNKVVGYPKPRIWDRRTLFVRYDADVTLVELSSEIKNRVARVVVEPSFTQIVRRLIWPTRGGCGDPRAAQFSRGAR